MDPLQDALNALNMTVMSLQSDLMELTEANQEVTATSDEVATKLDEQIDNFDATVDNAWLLLSGYLVFFMQAGFASLESGSVRAKNTRNILLKNVMDAALGALIWWAIGFPFAFGESSPGANDVQGFIGRHQFFLADYTLNQNLNLNPYRRILEFGVSHAFWFFQWTFAATAATIVSGAVAERCRFVAYLFYTVFITGFIYPVVVHWVWSTEGYLSAFQVEGLDNWENIGEGMIDFAGSGVVHMTGGMAALVAATLLGPRHGRFDKDGKVADITPHSAALAGLGVLFLWFGWYGFNPGSTLALSGGFHNVAAKVAVTTTLSAAAGGSTSLLISFLLTQEFNLFPALNGVLAGLVAICSGTATVEPYAAVIIGMLAAGVYTGASKLLIRLRIDDPLEASPVHFFSGFFGLYATAFFSTRTNVTAAYGENVDKGIFYGGDGELFLANFAGSFLISIWVFVTSFLLFFMLKFTGLFRVPQEEEEAGLDVSHHGGHAYEWMDQGPKGKTAEKPAENPKGKTAEKPKSVEMASTASEEPNPTGVDAPPSE